MLSERIKTSIILLISVLVVLLVLPSSIRLGVFALIGVLCALEWSRFLSDQRAWRVGFIGFNVLLLVAALGLPAFGVPLLAWLWAAMVFWAYMTLHIVVWPQRLSGLLKWVGGVAVLVPAAVATVMLLTTPSTLLGGELFLLLWALVAAADVGAYFAGRAFGKRKLAPLVSPGKSWEGVAGGLVLSVVVGQIGAPVFGFEPWPWMGLTVMIVAASVVGDLTESLFKRHAGVKDSGHFLPGHGGVMDRLDGLVAALPFYVAGLAWLGLWHP